MKTHILMDRVGMSLSSLCIIHCLFLPIIGTALPVFGVWSEVEWIHKALVLTAIPVALDLVISKTQRRIRLLAILGLSLLILTAFWEPLHEIETSVTVFGALSLGLAHMFRLGNRPHSH